MVSKMVSEMMCDELVSVIIPVFNVKPYLNEALDSIINQTYLNLEIVIIDDGSTDGSGEICDEYAQKDGRVIAIHQENKGLSSARNNGLDNANGHYIAFLDPDDAFHPKMIQILVKVLMEQEADVAICKFDVIKTDARMESAYIEKDVVQSSVIEKDEALRRIFDGRINTAIWDKLYVKELWEDIRFPDGHVYEGTYIAFDLFNMTNRVAVINEKLVLHRNRPHSICNTFSLSNILDGEHAAKHYSAFVIEHTPEIFSDTQVKQYMRIRVKGLIATYLFYQWKNPNDLEGMRFLRKLLKEVAEEGSMCYCNPRLRLLYKIVALFPGFSSTLYGYYRKIRGVTHRRNNDL